MFEIRIFFLLKFGLLYYLSVYFEFFYCDIVLGVVLVKCRFYFSLNFFWVVDSIDYDNLKLGS